MCPVLYHCSDNLISRCIILNTIPSYFPGWGFSLFSVWCRGLRAGAHASGGRILERADLGVSGWRGPCQNQLPEGESGLWEAASEENAVCGQATGGSRAWDQPPCTNRSDHWYHLFMHVLFVCVWCLFLCLWCSSGGPRCLFSVCVCVWGLLAADWAGKENIPGPWSPPGLASLEQIALCTSARHQATGLKRGSNGSPTAIVKI